MNDYEKNLLANIERYGCSVTSVADPDGKEPRFSYSIGIARSSGAPELIIVGLGSKLGHQLVNVYNDRVCAGERFVSGQLYDGFLDGYPVQFIPVSPAQREAYMLSAVWLHGGPDFEALQMVWPSLSGAWPWDGTADAGFVADQPLLGGSAP